MPVSRILAIGLAIRLLLAPFTSWTHDVYPFYRASMDMAGGLDPYDTSFYTYPPLWAYVLFPLFSLLGILVSPESFAETVPSIGPTAEVTEMIIPTVTAPLFNLILKLPLIGADLGIAIILLRWVSSSYDQDHGKSVLLLWFLNPLVIWINAAHGQFDVIPAFFTLASCLLLVQRRFFYGGLALGLAILFKLYPAFLLISLLFLVIALERRASKEGKQDILPLLRSSLLFLLGVALILASMGLPLLWTRFIEVTLVRRAQFTIIGGFNPFFFLALDIWEYLPLARTFLIPLPRIASPYLLVLPVIISVLAGLAVFRKFAVHRNSGDMGETVAYVTILPLVALYSALVLVNPQHLLWVLPFLVLGSARWRGLTLLTIIISLAGLFFLLSLQGVAPFFYSLAVFTPLVSVEGLNGQVEGYWGLPGIVSSRLQNDFLFFTSGLGYIALLMAAYRVAKHWQAQPGEDERFTTSSTQTQYARMPGAELTKFSALATAFLVVSQGVVMYEAFPSGGSMKDVSYDPSNGILTVGIQGHGLYDASYRITVVGLSQRPLELPIYMYHDDNYPISNTSRPRIFGIMDHLRGELVRAGLNADVKIVDAESLVSLLKGPPAILIMSTTALPQELFFPDSTLAREWIEGGGVLIWTGALIGAYLGIASGRVVDMTKLYRGWRWGPSFIMGFDPIGEQGLSRADISTSWKEALDIRFPLAAWGASVDQVEARGGVVLGAITRGENPKSSLTVLPVGKGAVALFGDAPGQVFTYSAEDIIAHDIARLILSGLLVNPDVDEGILLATRRVSLEAGTKAIISLPVEPSVNATLLRVLVLSEVDFDPLMVAEDLSL